MNQDYNNYNQNNLNQQGANYIYDNQQHSNQTQPFQSQSIEPPVQNNYSINDNYSNNHKPKRHKLKLVFGLIIAIVIAIIVIFKSGATGPDKLVCKSDKGNLTIMYNKNELVDYEADGIDYDLDADKLEANKIGVEKYIIAMYSWFVDTKQGTCTVEGKSKNTIINSPLIDELHEVYEKEREAAALRSAELVVSGVEYAYTSYMVGNNGNIPTSISDLKPYLTFDNFEVTDEGIITEKEWSGSTKISCELKMVTGGVQVACPNVKGYNTKIVPLK